MKVFINENIVTPGKMWEPISEEEFKANIQGMLASISCFNYFNESELYFNSVGIRKLLEDLDFAEEVNNYALFDEIAQLREIFKELDGTDWSQNRKHKDDHNYLVQLGDGFCPHPFNGTSIAEACEYNFQKSKTVVLNFISSQFNTYGVLNVNRVNTKPPKEMNLISLNSICSKEETIKYYLKNRAVIEYNHNSKHGENHSIVKIINGEKISPLECTIEEASALLKVAIGNKKVKELFSYHTEKGKFIEYKAESGSNNKYHGYHPHDQKIPNDVKLFLDENRGFFILADNT